MNSLEIERIFNSAPNGTIFKCEGYGYWIKIKDGGDVHFQTMLVNMHSGEVKSFTWFKSLTPVSLLEIMW